MDDIIYMENKGVNNLGWKIKKADLLQFLSEVALSGLKRHKGRIS